MQKYAKNMQTYAWICKQKYANICNKYACISTYMHKICKYMHKICMKYARNMQKNMQEICKKYAKICKYMQGSLCPWNMQKYANYMQVICKNMQNMQSRFAYAKYAKICTPHFADVGLASDHFHIFLPIQIKTFSPQEFTSAFDLMNFCAQRAKFCLVDFDS